jgi:hypothetical protein
LLVLGAFAAGWASMLPLLDRAVEKIFVPRRIGSIMNGAWSTRLDLARSNTSGVVRAYVAQIGLAANQAEEALYWTALVDDAGRRLDGGHSYSLVFRQRPPVADTGFWSLTVYGADSFLVPNPDKRYSIGDRSLPKQRDDGSFTVRVSAQKPATESDSWLPAPPAGPFSLTLRMFVPLPVALEHPASIPLPSITCVDCR